MMHPTDAMIGGICNRQGRWTSAAPEKPGLYWMRSPEDSKNISLAEVHPGQGGPPLGTEFWSIPVEPPVTREDVLPQ